MSTDSLVEDFRIAAMEKGEEGGSLDHHLHKRMCDAYAALMALGPPGKTAFESLLQDPSPTVRSWVAAQMLALGSKAALRVMRELSEQPGIAGFNASVTLSEYEAGRLKPPLTGAAA